MPPARIGKAFFVLNPTAGSGRLRQAWGGLAGRLRSQIKNFDFAWTQARGDAAHLTSQALNDGYDLIVAVGGDGTLNECVNGFIENDRPKNPEAALGILPFGRGSDFGRGLGIPRDPVKAMELFSRPKLKALDVGKAGFTDLAGKPGSGYFINIANVGIVPQVVNRARQVPKAFGAKASYLYGAVKGILEYRSASVICSGIEGVAELPLLNMVIANGIYFGSGMKIAPKAEPDDGLFDVLTVEKMRLVDFLRHIPTLYTGKVLKIPQVHYSRNAWVELKPKAAGDQVPVEMDGDTVGHLPACFEILPRLIRFVVPSV